MSVSRRLGEVTSPPPADEVGFHMPAALAREAAAAGTTMSVVAEAVELAVAGGPQQMAADWFDRAACRGVARHVFYPTRGAPQAQFAKIRARVCGSCPVRAECLASALASGATPGGQSFAAVTHAAVTHAAVAMPVTPPSCCGEGRGVNAANREHQPQCLRSKGDTTLGVGSSD